MTVKETVKRALINYPLIFPNAFHFYTYAFLTIGGSYEWKNGQLDSTDKENNRHDLRQAISRNLNMMLHSLEYKIQIMQQMNTINAFNIVKSNMELVKLIDSIFDFGKRAKDYTMDLPGEPFDGFRISKNYSNIMLLPDNITEDWLRAAVHMYDIMNNNKDRIKDGIELLPVIEERIEKLKLKFHYFDAIIH